MLLAKWRIRSRNGSDRARAGRFVLIFVRQRQWDGGTGLKKEVEEVLTVLNQAAEAAYSV